MAQAPVVCSARQENFNLAMHNLTATAVPVENIARQMPLSAQIAQLGITQTPRAQYVYRVTVVDLARLRVQHRAPSVHLAILAVAMLVAQLRVFRVLEGNLHVYVVLKSASHVPRARPVSMDPAHAMLVPRVFYAPRALQLHLHRKMQQGVQRGHQIRAQGLQAQSYHFLTHLQQAPPCMVVRRVRAPPAHLWHRPVVLHALRALLACSPRTSVPCSVHCVQRADMRPWSEPLLVPSVDLEDTVQRVPVFASNVLRRQHRPWGPPVCTTASA